ncbi:MAG: PAS domain S-box protein [Nitrospirales bacterium]
MVSQPPFSPQQWVQLTGIVIVTGLIFALDLATPLGVATGALYLFVILATLFMKQRNFTLFMGGLTTVLVIVGLFLSPENGKTGYAILNRIIQIAAIGATIPLTLRQISILNRLTTDEERLDLAFHATDEGIWDWPDMNHDQQWWAPQFYALLGHKPGDISPSFSQFKAFLHPDDYAPTLQALEDHLKDQVPFDKACRLKTRSNEYGWFRVRGKSSQRDLNGQRRMVGSIDDITQQKKAEDQFRLVIEAAPAGMLMIDAQGTIVLANQRLTTQFGYTSEELLGQPMECLVPARFQANHPAHRNSFFVTPTPRQMGSGRELYGLRKDGTEFPVEIGLNPVTSEDGTFVLASVIDISERKKRDALLADQNRLLALDAQVAGIISQTQELQSILQQCTEAIVDHFHAAFAYIWTQNPTQSIFELQASAGLSTHPYDPHSRIPLGQFKIGKIVAEKKPYLTNSVIGNPHIPEQEWAIQERLVAFAGYPLLRGEEVVGVLAVFSQHSLTGLTLETLEMVSERITTAIERHEINQAHQELSRQYQLILHSAGKGIWGLDSQGRTTFINSMALSLLGYTTPEEIVGCSMHTKVHHTYADGTPYPENKCPMHAALTDGTFHHIEDEVLWRQDGTCFPVSYSSTPIRNQQNDLVGAVVVFSDVTERIQQERHLQELSNRLTLATQSAELGIWEWRVEENILNWDSQMYALYGFSTDSESEPYTTWSNALHPEDRTSTEELLQKAVRGEAEFLTEFRILWPDNSIRWIKTTGLVERDPTGMALRMIGVNWDVTESKEAEKAISQYTKDLEVSNRELDDFAYITSHDLKEPLRGIANYGRFLLEDHGPLLPAEGKEQCQTIIKLTQRMESLIESLRYFSQLGRADLTIARNSLDDILDDIILTLQPRLEETQVTIKRPAPFPTWACDAIRIREALANLITNAMKYNDKAEKWIELTSQILTNSGQLEIAVRDNGIGIPEAHRQNIFRIFRRLHGRDKFGGGDGAGLTIVKKIVERHGGSIRLESAVGEGTTFLIVLPFFPSEEGQNS